MKTPILGGTYVARSVNAANSRLVNLFPEVVPEGGKEPAFLQRAPGLQLLASIGDGPIRGQWVLNQTLYAVSGALLYAIDVNWNPTLIGTILGSGPVSMVDNGTQIFIACGPIAYIYNASTGVLQQITDPDFTGAVTVGYIDGYFVYNEPNSQKIWVTALLDGTDINPLDFASAEGSPDNLVSLIVDHREVWLFGENSVEVWYDAGTPDFPLQRIQGAFNEIGCAAAFSVAKLDNSLFWLGKDARGQGIVYKANGYTGQRISTHAVEWHIQQYGDLTGAVGYTYQQDGHAFYVLNFTDANTTWVYDVSTGEWHERAAWDNGQFERHWGNNQSAFNNKIVVGDYRNGNLYAFDLDVYKDNNQPQKWLRSWRALPTGQNNLKRTAQHTLQLDAETGTYFQIVPATVEYMATEGDDVLITEDGDPLTVMDGDQAIVAPQYMLRWSDDGGHTWSNEHWRSGGAYGEYGTRVRWLRLGMTTKLRDRVYEVSMTDPVKIAIMGAELTANGTNA